jgi:hypothetical protein
MFRYFIVILCILIASPIGAAAANHPASGEGSDSLVRLPGHVLPALAQATRADLDVSAEKSNKPLTLTLVLKRDDQAGFDRYLHDVYDPKSKIYRKFLNNKEIAANFGPSRDAYDSVLRYLKKNGFELAEGSANRMTLTVRGSRNEANKAFNIHIGDYIINHRSFYANDNDPALPENMAQYVGTVAGLANLATVSPNEGFWDIITAIKNAPCNISATIDAAIYRKDNLFASDAEVEAYRKKRFAKCYVGLYSQAAAAGALDTVDPPAPAWQGVDGTGQTVGVVAFDTFLMSDVQDFINFLGHPTTQINQLSQVHVNGGANPGPNQNEVLLDIANVLGIAPGANIVVFDAPFTGAGTSFQNVFNAMINSGVTIISNSWAYCEDQTTLADVQSIDIILQAAAASGISVITGSGDHGSTCLDGSPNTAHVPATSPHITSVGGTSLTVGPGYTYGGETWWNNGSGQGGFGISKFFARPSYQDGLNNSPMRSIPDISANADPSHGVLICQARAGGCPTGLLNGGTSSSAPAWAAFTALLNQAQGSNLGFLNPLIYPFAHTDAFHNGASMGSDFAHVGLGSANLAHLHRHLTGQTAGSVSASVSRVGISIAEDSSPPPLPGVPADGIFQAAVVVKLADDNGNVVSGKSVSLAANGGNAQITPASGISEVDNGSVIFRITDITPETLTFTATNTTDGIVLDQKPTITFVTPPATSAGINAFPATVNADGTSTTTITVNLVDSLNRPTPGKLITLSQGGGHSVITGPNPGVTDANGQITFTATDRVNETVTYSAEDVTDSNLPVPGNPQVTFSGGSGFACGQSAPPVGANGYVITPYISGFDAGPFFYGNVNWGGCPGGTLPAFGQDSIFVTSFKTGGLYKLGLAGGAISSSNLLSTTAPTLLDPIFGKDGKLYDVFPAGASGFSAGSVVELNPVTGNVLRTIAAGLTCPSGLVVDPLSGDLFYNDRCSGAGSNDAHIYRIQNPGSNTASVMPYVTLPASPNGLMAFAPNGSLYVVTGYGGATAPVYRVAGTDTPSPPAIIQTNAVSDFSLAIGETLANGDAKSLIVHAGNDIKLVDITTNPVTETVLANGALVAGVSGPDGCLYMTTGDTVYKLSKSGGGCTFVTTSPNPSLSLALAAGSPGPAQGNPETFNATLNKVPAPAGTPVFFTVTGANPQIKLVRSDADGKAALTYAAVFAGKDTITAAAAINGVTLSSNPVQVTWAAGEHVTFLSLNLSPGGGTQNKPVNVIASLSDVSANPAAALANENVDFNLGGGTCSATTDAKGVASCSITPIVLGMGTLTANFAGRNKLMPATASTGFNTMEPPAVEPSPTVTISVTPTTVAPGATVALTWFSTNAASCTASGSWSGPQSTSGNLNVSQAQSGSYTYTLACNGPGGSASKSASLTVKSIACDINLDGDVDRDDIKLIMAALNQSAASGDPRDYNKDGRITINDVRACTLQCTRLLCATN